MTRKEFLRQDKYRILSLVVLSVVFPLVMIFDGKSINDSIFQIYLFLMTIAWGSFSMMLLLPKRLRAHYKNM